MSNVILVLRSIVLFSTCRASVAGGLWNLEVSGDVTRAESASGFHGRATTSFSKHEAIISDTGHSAIIRPESNAHLQKQRLDSSVLRATGTHHDEDGSTRVTTMVRTVARLEHSPRPEPAVAGIGRKALMRAESRTKRKDKLDGSSAASAANGQPKVEDATTEGGTGPRHISHPRHAFNQPTDIAERRQLPHVPELYTETTKTLSGSHVESRLAATRQVLGKSRMMVVIKNVDDPITWAKRVLASATKVDYIGVENLKTARAMRSEGIQSPLLVLYPGAAMPEDCAELADSNIEVAVASWTWARHCGKFGKPLLHIFVDTGHGVSGVLPYDAVKLLDNLLGAGFEIRGFMSHLCCESFGVPEKWYKHLAGVRYKELEQMHNVQAKRIAKAMSSLKDLWEFKMMSAGVPRHRPLIHVAASGSVALNNTGLFYDMVRVGRYIIDDEYRVTETVHQAVLSAAPSFSSAHMAEVYQSSGSELSKAAQVALLGASPWLHTRSRLESILEGSAIASARDVVLTPHVEKILSPGWCLGYYCWHWPGDGVFDIFDKERRVATVVKQHTGSPHHCKEVDTGSPVPLLVDYDVAGMVFDLASVSSKRPLKIRCRWRRDQ